MALRKDSLKIHLKFLINSQIYNASSNIIFAKKIPIMVSFFFPKNLATQVHTP